MVDLVTVIITIIGGLAIILGLFASIITILERPKNKPKFISSPHELQRNCDYGKRIFKSDTIFQISWGYKVCFQVFNLKVVFPVQKEILLKEIPKSSTFKIYDRPIHSKKYEILSDRYYIKQINGTKNELFLLSETDVGSCHELWSKLGDSDYQLNIASPLSDDDLGKVVRQVLPEQILITNNIGEIVMNYPCIIPSGFQIADLASLEEYDPSVNPTSDGQTILMLNNIKCEEGNNIIHIPILRIPPESPVPSGSA